MSKPVIDNFDLTQGEDFFEDWVVSDDGEPLDISDWVLTGQIRATAGSPDVLATFAFEKSLTLVGGVTARVPGTVTAALPAGRLVYDMWATYGDAVDAPVKGGVVTVHQRITRPA